MTITLQQLAQLVDGELHGDGEIEIRGATILRDAAPGDVTLCERAELTRELNNTQAAAVLLPPDLSTQVIPYITVEDVAGAFAKIIYQFRPPRSGRNIGLSPDAHISRFAKFGENVQVHPGAIVGDDVEIGDHSVIHSGVHLLNGCKIAHHVTIFPGAMLYETTVVGNHCIIHANAVLGAYGFGYDTVNGEHQLSAQLGYVELEDRVDVGAGTTIDRGTYGPTVIGYGSKIDNQVQIAHNCRIGKHNIICSQVGIAGSTTTGDYVVMAGQVGVRDHVHIGDKAQLGAKAGVSSDIPGGQVYLGSPATPICQQKLRFASLSKLPEMRKQFRQLQKEFEQLKSALQEPTDAA